MEWFGLWTGKERGLSLSRPQINSVCLVLLPFYKIFVATIRSTIVLLTRYPSEPNRPIDQLHVNRAGLIGRSPPRRLRCRPAPATGRTTREKNGGISENSLMEPPTPYRTTTTTTTRTRFNATRQREKAQLYNVISIALFCVFVIYHGYLFSLYSSPPPHNQSPYLHSTPPFSVCVCVCPYHLFSVQSKNIVHPPAY